jgi:hypothetical protein
MVVYEKILEVERSVMNLRRDVTQTTLQFSIYFWGVFTENIAVLSFGFKSQKPKLGTY